jgi:dienelactone hydrolase
MTEEAVEPGGAPSRWQRLKGGAARFWRKTEPSPRLRRCAVQAAWLLVGAAAAAVGSTLRIGLGRAVDPLLGALVGLAIVTLVGLGTVLALRLLDLVRRFTGRWGLAALVASGFVLVLGLSGLGMPLTLAAAVALVTAIGFAGGALAALRDGAPGRSPRSAGRRGALLAAVALPVALLAAALGWLFLGHGGTDHLVKEKPLPGAGTAAPLALPDPTQRGPYAVRALTYGSGTDRRRPEFGSKVTIKVPPVDGTPFVKGNEGWRISARQWFWGFGFDKWPRNARVWMPQGTGPFPVALIVHGNHDMADFSDPGYAYLGELLASRGIILASVDENFLNGSWLGGVDKENDARGWLLLKHLELWRQWARDPKSPFFGKVDLERLAVMGHSRGGEAALLAATFNRLSRYPDDGNVRFNFDFAIRAVVAIAPIDGQYKPTGRPAPIADVDYLLLQGAHDADVSFFSGDRAFRRLSFPGGGYHFKASVYDYRANHGQFNTAWGDGDVGWPGSFLLDRAALLPAAEQRRIALATISAFFEASLHDRREYLAFLRDPRRGAAWLPRDLRISRFEDSTFRPVATFEGEGLESFDLSAATLPGAHAEGKELAVWAQEDLTFRSGGSSSKQNQVLRLGWRKDPKKIARYTLALPAGAAGTLRLGADALLTFAAADTGQKPPDDEKKKDEGKDQEKGKKKDPAAEAKEKQEGEKKEKDEKARQEREKKEGKTPLDWTVELVDGQGRIARLPLSRFRTLPVTWASRFTRVPGSEKDRYGDPWEITLQTFELPLAAFAGSTPGFDPASLAAVRFVFDRSPEGVIVIDDLGFADAAPPAR